MSSQFTNVDNLPISLAVWLATDDYDYNDDPTVISATSLLKPLRAIVLARQNAGMLKVGDVSSLIPSRMGTALHTAIETAWINPIRVRDTLNSLGYPKGVSQQVLVNPTEAELLLAETNNEPIIPIYMEQRRVAPVEGMKISGKFDFVSEGVLEDFKSTSVYAYTLGGNGTAYIQQGSIYRWLFPEIITADEMYIRFIFTDWDKSRTLGNSSYPKSRIVSKKYPLMSLQETDTFIRQRVNDITKLMGASQDQLPLCTAQDLWQKQDTYKYYKNPANRTRATKNYDNRTDAHAHLAKDGHVGVVVFFPGEVVRCKYCDVVGICDQAATLVQQGLLNFT